jgi:hypothetical protein
MVAATAMLVAVACGQNPVLGTGRSTAGCTAERLFPGFAKCAPESPVYLPG